eukprot:3444798-Ditylum_brightwellii.AAC.1
MDKPPNTAKQLHPVSTRLAEAIPNLEENMGRGTLSSWWEVPTTEYNNQGRDIEQMERDQITRDLSAVGTKASDTSMDWDKLS